jgi:hypothetical protein
MGSTANLVMGPADVVFVPKVGHLQGERFCHAVDRQHAACPSFDGSIGRAGVQ